MPYAMQLEGTGAQAWLGSRMIVAAYFEACRCVQVAAAAFGAHFHGCLLA